MLHRQKILINITSFSCKRQSLELSDIWTLVSEIGLLQLLNVIMAIQNVNDSGLFLVVVS